MAFAIGGKILRLPAVTDLLEHDPEAFHRRLDAFNRRRLTPALPTERWRTALANDLREVAREIEFVELERRAVSEIASRAPTDGKGFIGWFESLRETGPGQGDPLFPWLAEDASKDEMRWFLQQEISGEAGFEDLTALTQIKFPQRAKLEMASNYWDEMGQGHTSGMHGPMLQRLAEELGIDGEHEPPVWESLALANVMVAMATQRRYAYHSVGALGVIEQTAPGRARLVNAGLKRLGIGGEARKYFALHATLDIKHSQTWNREVLHPLVEANPSVAVALAEGALLRLKAGERCFRRYRRELGLDVSRQDGHISERN